MIVVATNNGKDYLPASLEAFEQFGTGGHEVLVLDTGSTCPQSLSLLDILGQKKWSFGLKVGRTPYRGYDSGAFIYSFYNYPAETYIFLQDTVAPKAKEWTEAFEANLSHGVGCVPWLVFPTQWNSQEQIDWVMQKLNTVDWPPMGVFGPIFCASRRAMEDLDKHGYLDTIPTCKHEQMAMERLWSTAFILAGWGVRPIECVFDERRLKGDAYRHLTKKFAIRA